MNSIRVLSSFTLASFLSVNAGAAIGAVSEQATDPASSSQSEPVLVADLFRTIRDAVQTIQQVDQTVDAVNSLIEQDERQRELEAARQAATEQQRLEAERRQQYFESLSPEEQQAYLAEQRARQEQADGAAALLLMMLFSGGSDSGQQDGTCRNTRAVPDGEGGIYHETLTPESARALGLVCN